MKIVRESLFQGPNKEEVFDKVKDLIRDETDGEIDIDFSSFSELIEKFLLKVTSARKWSVRPQSIENVNTGEYEYMIPPALVPIMEAVPFVGDLTKQQAYNLQSINLSEEQLKDKVGIMAYDDEELELEGDLYFILDNKGKIYKAIFLQV